MARFKIAKRLALNIKKLSNDIKSETRQRREPSLPPTRAIFKHFRELENMACKSNKGKEIQHSRKAQKVHPGCNEERGRRQSATAHHRNTEAI